MNVNAFDRFVILILLVIVLFTGPVTGSTVSFLAACFLLIILIIRIRKISTNEMILILPLVFIVFLGIIGTLINKRFMTTDEIYLFGKDTWYFIKPIIFLLIGFYLYRTGLPRENFIGLVILVALVTAVYHVARVVIYISFINHNYILDTLKTHTSFTSVLEAFSLAFILGRERYSSVRENVYFRRWLIITVFSVSIVLSFSRTVMVAFIIAMLSMAGLFSYRLNILLKTLFGLILVTILGYLLLIVVHNASRKDSNLDLFTEKFLNSVNEITFNKTEVSFREINNNWRGIETLLAKNSLRQGDVIDKSIGFGFGKTVFIDHNSILGPENVNIPIFHNGFIQLRLKSGYAGLLLYMTFFALAFWIVDRSLPSSIYDNFLKAILITAFVSTLVITGLYNKTVFDPCCIIIGYFISLNLSENKSGNLKKTQ